MTNLVFSMDLDHGGEIMRAAAEITESSGFHRDAQAIAAVDAETRDILAVAVFQSITEAGCEVHLGATRPHALADRRIIQAFAAFAFFYLKVPAVTGIIPAENVVALSAALRAGFRPCGFVQAGPLCLKDAMVLTMRRGDCRWLPRRDPNVTLMAGAFGIAT